MLRCRCTKSSFSFSAKNIIYSSDRDISQVQKKKQGGTTQKLYKNVYETFETAEKEEYVVANIKKLAYRLLQRKFKVEVQNDGFKKFMSE